MFKYLHHIGVVVRDLDAAAHFLHEVLGLEFEGKFDVPLLDRRVAFYRCGEARIEIIEVLEPTARDRVLGDGPAHLKHIALEVGDIHAVAGRLANMGVQIDQRGVVRVGARLNAWTDPSTSHGIMFQLTAEISGTEPGTADTEP